MGELVLPITQQSRPKETEACSASVEHAFSGIVILYSAARRSLSGTAVCLIRVSSSDEAPTKDRCTENALPCRTGCRQSCSQIGQREIAKSLIRNRFSTRAAGRRMQAHWWRRNRSVYRIQVLNPGWLRTRRRLPSRRWAGNRN